MLRATNNTQIKDRVSVRSMLTKFGLLYVNQLAAQIVSLDSADGKAGASYPGDPGFESHRFFHAVAYLTAICCQAGRQAGNLHLSVRLFQQVDPTNNE